MPSTTAEQKKQLRKSVRSLLTTLSPEERAYLEAPYVPHALVGVMAQNTPGAAGEAHV